MYWPDSLTRQRLPPPRCGSDGAETWLRRAVGIAHTALQSRKPRLDAVLPVDDGHVRAGLAGAVERRGEDVDELLVVGNADRGRARVRECRRNPRGLAVDVDRERVHQRLRPAARAIGGAQVADERR